MRIGFAIGIGIAVFGGASLAASAQTVADRQWHIDDILTAKDARAIEAQRAQCAVGRAEAMIANTRSMGFKTLPDAASWCIATLTRLGRDGALSYVRDPSTTAITPSLAFDNGFVTGYSRRAAIPADAPSMATLQTVAARCIGQREPDTALCNAAGYATGARAARGELPIVQ